MECDERRLLDEWMGGMGRPRVIRGRPRDQLRRRGAALRAGRVILARGYRSGFFALSFASDESALA